MIQCYISLAADDAQAAVLLAAPQNWSIYLVRRTSLSSSSRGNLSSSETSGAIPISNFSDVISQGRFWLADQDDQHSGFAVQGEVAIPRGATPTFDFPSISVYVSVPTNNRQALQKKG